MLLDLPDSGGTLYLSIAAPATGASVRINGVPVANLPHATASAVAVAVPPGVANAAVDRVELEFSGTPTSVGKLAKAPDSRGWPIGTSGAFLPSTSTLVVQSAGNEVGDVAHLWINGRDAARSGGEPAYNLLALDAQGTVAESALFDTHGSAQASAAMAAWIARWPMGTVIAGAVADEASTNLGADAVQALAQLGVEGDLRGKLRWSHAFIGVVGAPPGSALEAITLLQTATVYVGAPVAGAAVSGGIGQIRFESFR